MKLTNNLNLAILVIYINQMNFIPRVILVIQIFSTRPINSTEITETRSKEWKLKA